MMMPFINFDGKCLQAIALYESVFTVQNKQVQLYRDMPGFDPLPERMHDYVLHAEMTIAGSPIWLSDSTKDVYTGNLVSIAVTLPDVDAVNTAYYKLLNASGEAVIEIAPTFYSPMFGTVQDQFGVIWHLMCRA